MDNAELIAALRWCPSHGCGRCVAVDENGVCTLHGVIGIMNSSADALEAAGKRIANLQEACAEFEAQLSKEGKCEAKKPKTVKEEDYSFYCDCPTCGGRLISNVGGEWCAGTFDRFCRRCGQKIDWSEYCGWSNKPSCGARMKGEQE